MDPIILPISHSSITDFITKTENGHENYTVTHLIDCLHQINQTLSNCNEHEKYQLLNSNYSYLGKGHLLTLWRIIIVTIHDIFECHNHCHNTQNQRKVLLLMHFGIQLIKHGLNPMIPFWKCLNTVYDDSAIVNGRIFNGFNQSQSWSLAAFNKFSENSDFDKNADTPSLNKFVFECMDAFNKHSGDIHYCSDFHIEKVPVLTIPIWSNECDSFLMRMQMKQMVHSLWICGSAFLSIKGERCGDFTPNLLEMSIDRWITNGWHELFVFVDVGSQSMFTHLSDETNDALIEYDHAFVIRNKIKNRKTIQFALNRIIDFAILDMDNQSRNQLYYGSHYSVLLYLFIFSEFYNQKKQNMINEIKYQLYYKKLENNKKKKKNGMALIPDIVNMIIQTYLFEDNSFLDELSCEKQNQLKCVCLTQFPELSVQWQNWVSDNLDNLMSAQNMNYMSQFLSENDHISQYVVSNYKNKKLEKFVLDLYNGVLTNAQIIAMVADVSVNQSNIEDILLNVFNSQRIDFSDANIGNLFEYVLLSLILCPKSEIEVSESMMHYVMGICQIYKGHNTNCVFHAILSNVYSTLCRYSTSSCNDCQIENIKVYLRYFIGYNDKCETFYHDYNDGFVECVSDLDNINYNMLSILLEFGLLDYDVCEKRYHMPNLDELNDVKLNKLWHDNDFGVKTKELDQEFCIK